MTLPRLWTQGQLFALSALDGNSVSADDFVGTLCGDKIGIRFYTAVKRELVIVNEQNAVYSFDAVTSDYLAVHYENGGEAHIVYADRHVIVGTVGSRLSVVSTVEGAYTAYAHGGVRIEKTAPDEFTALYAVDGRFVYAFGKTEDEVLENVEKGRELNLSDLVQRKRAWYGEHGAADAHPFAALYNKCLSVMKTQLYAPEGQFHRIWSTPDRLPHRKLWLWDSVFHAIGFRNVDPALAEGLILALFDVQDTNGFIPHCAGADYRSAITQPPVIAWGAWLVYEKSRNKAFLKTVFAQNKRFLEWCRRHRKLTDKELYTWNTQSDVDCRCDESGMDNSPRFDIHKRLFAIDFSCFMANETRSMQKIAELLDEHDDVRYFKEWNARIVRDVNDVLWCDADGFYYDVIIEDGAFHKIASVASFLPLFAGVCDKKRAAALAAELQNPETFGTPFPIPSISKKDATFGSDMWRGPVWINYNYMIAEGLGAYGYTDSADRILDTTVRILNEWYTRKGTIFEFYDCNNRQAPEELNRKGAPLVPYDITVKFQSIREYGWSTTLLLDLLHNRYTTEDVV